jgi:hypothetical protein
MRIYVVPANRPDDGRPFLTHLTPAPKTVGKTLRETTCSRIYFRFMAALRW